MIKAIKSILPIIILTIIISGSQDSSAVVAQADISKNVILGGEPFGIRMFSDGVLVTEVEDTLFGTNIKSPAKKAGINKNDIIKSANGIRIYTNEDFSEILAEFVDTDIDLTVERNSELINISLKPIYDATGQARAGMWIKDSAAGIGTVTFYDTSYKTFGALGHGICESETGALIPLYSGEIVKANINSVTKSENGNVGSLNGYFEDITIGSAFENSNYGIFGYAENLPNAEYIETGTKSQVYVGNAQIYCTISGKSKEAYDIKIRKLSNNSENSGMIIEITDPELLEVTGGIVQGMSGSPIVQDGKLIGAVTHVLVNNVNCGYGIFIEDMLTHSCTQY